MSPDGVAVAERALALLCVYQAAGAAFFLAWFEPWIGRSRVTVRRLALVAALCAMVLVLIQPLLAAARMAGDFGGVTNRALLLLAWRSRNGLSVAAQCVGLAVLVGGLHWAGMARRTLLLLGGAIAAGALVLTGHTSVHAQRELLAPLLLLHLLVVAFWFGALIPLCSTLAQETTVTAAAVLQRFSRLAGWLVPGIALAGLAMSWLLIDDWTVLRRPYGLLLLGKLCVFAVLMVLATANRWRFVPALLASPEAMRGALRRSMVAEFTALIAVLGATAALTLLFSPDD